MSNPSYPPGSYTLDDIKRLPERALLGSAWEGGERHESSAYVYAKDDPGIEFRIDTSRSPLGMYAGKVADYLIGLQEDSLNRESPDAPLAYNVIANLLLVLHGRHGAKNRDEAFRAAVTFLKRRGVDVDLDAEPTAWVPGA